MVCSHETNKRQSCITVLIANMVAEYLNQEFVRLSHSTTETGRTLRLVCGTISSPPVASSYMLIHKQKVSNISSVLLVDG